MVARARLSHVFPLTRIAEFSGLPNALLRRSLETLVKKGKAQLIRSGDGEGDGVRFL